MQSKIENDSDEFVQVECVIYDQSAGEEMAARIVNLEHVLQDCASKLESQVARNPDLPLSYRALVNRAFSVLRNENPSCETL